jgi:hypothetical protein
MQGVNIKEMTKYMVHEQDLQFNLLSGVRKLNINVLEFASAVYDIGSFNYVAKSLIFELIILLVYVG